MATGTLWYWNGISGWIKQTGVESMATVDARDVMLLAGDVASGTAARDSTVTFTVEANRDPWLARSAAIS